MESGKQPSTDFKSETSQYPSSLNDEDLVDMNEIIQCNLDNWNICTNNETELMCSQEIKLESYNFLGSKINYEDEKFELDAFRLPDNYFKTEGLHNYESEEELNTHGGQHVNGVINLADSSDEDDDVAVMNSSSSSTDTRNVLNVSIPNLESIRSDHNYSSQEIFVGSPDHPNDATEPEPEPTGEITDYVNEMQAMIANWMIEATNENKASILNDLENEIKRIKSTMLDVCQEINPTLGPKTPNGFEPNATNESEENDSIYVMSEGHSEPLEYRANRCVLTEDENMSEQIDEETIKTLKNLRLVIEKLSSKVTNISKSLANENLNGETAKTELEHLSNSGQELVESIKKLSEILNVEMEVESPVDKTVIENNDPASSLLVNESVNGQIADDIDKNVVNQVKDIVGNEIVNGKVDESVNETVDENAVEGANENAVESIDNKLSENSDDKGEKDENVDEIIDYKVDENVDVAEDKASKLNEKSKIKWLASSSEDESSSDESLSENVTPRRRKKRLRTSSTSDEAPLNKNARKKNVLLDSSDDERSDKDDSLTAELKKDQSSEEEEPVNFKDVDMTNYLLPSDASTNVLNKGGLYEDADDKNEQRVDSELEEFFGFDGPTCDVDDIRSPFDQDGVEPICERDTNIDEPNSTEVLVTEKDHSIDSEHTKEYMESQQWDLHEEPIILKNKENSEPSVRNPSPRIENETAAGNEDQIAKEADEENGIEEGGIEEGGNEEDGNEEDGNEENGNEENNHNEDEGSEYDTDEEINRLVDFSTIPIKHRPIVNHVPVYKKRSTSKPKPKEDILDILKDTASQDIESESSSEEEIISEEQYVLQLAKQKCLKDSSDDSDDGDSDSLDNDGQSSIDDVTDESNDSKLNSFLKKRLANEIENDLVSEGKIEENAPKVDTVNNDADEVKSEHELELESSGIFEPEIELHDGEKPVNKDQDSDADETTEHHKAPEEKKKWKLDKIAFNKNLFNNLDDLDEKKSNAINSDNSDCEMLDISMFKTKKTGGSLDKIIQNQKKRDVSKTSKVADAECISLSSDSDLEIDKGTIDDDSEDEKPTKSRPMLRNDQLAGETKQAQKEENDRLKRLEKKSARLTQIVESQTEKLSQSIDDSEVILDFDTKRDCAISVHPEIVKNLKEHQIAGVKFMYDCCYGSVDSIDKHSGSGCILAHCMGLGKTLQLIALLHTLIRYPQLKTKKILVICPKSTIMNWADEIQTWLRSVKVKLKVLHFPDPSDINKKLQILREWHSFKADPEGRAGCMLIGYEAFRSLVFYTEKPKLEMAQVDLDRIKKYVDEYLLKPGADLVVCDEGHVIKNRKSTTSRAVNKISSRRRIILTGTPIQNNLKEYYSMVNFIKPSFLGTEKEFANLYENPIKEGQHKDSNNGQIRIMKQRSYVLHKKLSKFVQRREAALLKTFLPEKYEYVLFIPMTQLQNRLYQHFLDNNPLKEKYGGKSLIPDYTFLRKIWTHPKVLENAWKNAVALRDKRAAARKRTMDSDEEPDDVLDNQVGKMSVENDWWRQFIEPQDLRSLLPSNKLRILFEILKLCEQNREKCLIFSAFVAVLDVVEYFMQQIHNKVPFSDGDDLGLDNFHGPWQRNYDYYRLDGKTSKSIRHAMIQNFNDPGNERVKCFLISAKAGGQGINLVGANRVILLDTSWNPSNDQQNIFRVFRLGQQRKCYIYRLLAMGTMEEKVYSRSVTKQAMSFRVVDEQQIDRHYSLNELAELYTLTIPDPAAQPTPVRPADNILANLLRNFKNLVYKYHEHDSLLENNSAEDLNEQEKADAWEAYEKDVSMKNQFGNINITADGMYNNPYMGMGLNMMNPYTYIPPNLPQNMVQSYLQRMGGYQNGVEQELLLMSQMYSQFNQSAGSTGYPLSAMFNSPSSGTTNPLYNSPSTNSNYYSKSSIPPITTASSSSYSNMPSNVFNGIGPLSSSSSSSSSAVAAAAAQYNLSRYLPSYTSSSSPIASAFPFNLYGASASASTANSAQQLATTQPGPNAIKNPLLSNLLPPPTSNTKDAFSIPTSVITKASKDVQRATNTSLSPTSMQVSRSGASNMVNQPSQSQQNSAHSLNKPMTSPKGSPLMVARTSPLSNARGSPAMAARISPSTHRSSPSDTRNNASTSRTAIDAPNSLSISRSSASMQKSSPNQLQTSQLPLSITLAGSRTSPEPNIIVKDVTAINRTVDRKPAATTSKTSAQPIKNFNMGIVYPKAPEKKSFDLQNAPLLKAAKNQLNQLNATRANAVPQNHSAKNRISLPPNRTASRPIMTAINRTNNVKSLNRAVDTNVASSLSSAAKNQLSNLPTNEVTITPTKRMQRVTLPMTAINMHKLAPSTTITPSTSQKRTIEINKLNTSALSVSRLPSSTSITRQTPISTSSANTNKALERIQNPPKPFPKISRPASIPTLKLISQPSNSVPSNSKAGGISRTTPNTTTAINRNQISRLVSTNNGASKMTVQRPQSNSADVRKVFTKPVPKLANFANESRKRKLEELIPKNTGITLIKKSKPDNPFVPTKKITPQRARDPSSSSTVEIVELD